MHKTITSLCLSFLLVAFTSTSVFFYYSIPRADAAESAQSCTGGALAGYAVSTAIGFVSGLFGKEVPSKDADAKSAITIADIKRCVADLATIAAKVALAKLKKRLMDKITDDTIKWINGETGSPQFITNFGDVLKQSSDEALGETLQASGMGKLCSERLNLQVQLSLRKPPTFSKQATCTLTGAAKNVAAFTDNFKTGGWLGYGQLLEPSNNRWGLELLAQNELDAKNSKLSEAAKIKTTSNQGYAPTVYCKAWTLQGVKQGDSASTYTDIATINYEAFPGAKELAPDADTRPLLESQITKDQLSNANNIFTNLKYRCKPEDKEGSTPGGVLAAVTAKAFTSDADVIANSDDLDQYVGAIFDAAINRLAKEGVKGITKSKGGLASRSSAKLTTPELATGADAAYTDGGDLKQHTNEELITQAQANFLKYTGRIDELRFPLATTTDEVTNVLNLWLLLQGEQARKHSRTWTNMPAYYQENPPIRFLREHAGQPPYATCTSTLDMVTQLNDSLSSLRAMKTGLDKLRRSLVSIDYKIRDNASSSGKLVTLITAQDQVGSSIEDVWGQLESFIETNIFGNSEALKELDILKTIRFVPAPQPPNVMWVGYLCPEERPELPFSTSTLP